MPQLRVKTGPSAGRTYELKREVIQLGREGEIQVLDALASRQHAEVFSIGDMFFVRDLDSRNGTYINEEKLSPQDQALLRVGDLIRIGTTQFVFEEAAPKGAEEPEFTSDEEEDFGATMELPLEAPAAAVAGDAQTLQFAVLYDMAKAISKAFDQKSLMEKLCDCALQATPAEAAYVFVHEKDKLVPRAHKRRTGPGERPADKQAPKISASIVKRAIQHKRSVLVADAGHDRRFSAAQSIIVKQIESVVCAPLLAHDHVVGVLYLHSSTMKGGFTDDHLRLVTALALQAAVALEAVRAQEESRRHLVSVFQTLIDAHERTLGPEYASRSDHVYRCARAICHAMELPPADAHRVSLAALLHGIGRIGGALETPDREGSRYEYATVGANMLRHIEGLEPIAAAVEAHRERLDGTGGPKKLIGHQIPREALIVGLAEEFERRLVQAVAKVPRSEAVKQVLMDLNRESGDRYDAPAFNGLVIALRTGAYRPS
jgi:response regulator RpfG family c-di-GMP phosphodiesterase/pSer/pThr/pTyr-binding forkhead associated (FHA) protein